MLLGVSGFENGIEMEEIFKQDTKGRFFNLNAYFTPVALKKVAKVSHWCQKSIDTHIFLDEAL